MKNKVPYMNKIILKTGLIILALIFSFLTLSPVSAGDEDEKVTDNKDKIAALGVGVTSFESKIAAKLVERDLTNARDRKKIINGLIKNINDKDLVKKNRVVVVESMMRLGYLEASEAVVELSEKLDFFINKNGVLFNQEAISSEGYPALKPLIQIGKPALPAIVDALIMKKRSDVFIMNARYVISTICGTVEKGNTYINERKALYVKAKGSRSLKKLLK